VRLAKYIQNIRHRDGLHPTYPLANHYKWVVDLVAMPMGLDKEVFGTCSGGFLQLSRGKSASNKDYGRNMSTSF